MSKHTPGPWDVEPTSDHAAAMRVMDEQEVTVALCYQQPFDSWTAEANARLIAKAPEMLTLLARVVAAEVGESHPDWYEGMEGDTAAAARAILANADQHDAAEGA